MAHGNASAQLVTTFDPGMTPPPQTSIDQALAQWIALSEAARAEALLLVYENDAERPRVFGRSAISQLVTETVSRKS